MPNMIEMSKKSVIDDITKLLFGNDPETCLKMIEGIKTVLQRKLLRTSIDVRRCSALSADAPVHPLRQDSCRHIEMDMQVLRHGHMPPGHQRHPGKH